MEDLFRLGFGEGPHAPRDRAILEVLYATGMRLAELVGMNRDETLELSRRRVKVLGKGNRERIVPFGGPAAAALEAYLDRTDGAARADRRGLPLFLGRGGSRIGRRSVQRLVRTHLSRVAARAALSPHLLRHTMATHLLARIAQGRAAGATGKAGATSDIRAVQEILGHVSLASTQVYTHVTVDRLRSALESAHPRGED
jgi:integrase/recombinase XerC